VKKIFLYGTFLLFIFCSCTSTNVTKNTVPHVYTNNISTDIEILGEVFFESKERVGYIEILKAGRRLYPDCHFVIDIMIDQFVTTTTKTTNMIFRKSQTSETDIVWIMRGTAVKYKNVSSFASLESSQSTRNNVNAGSTVTTTRSNNVIDESLVSSTPVVPTRTNIDTRTTNNERGYTVNSVVGNVQYQRNMGDTWAELIVGDILTQNIRIRTPLNASIILFDGNRTITIQGGREGRIDSLIGTSNR